MDNRLKALLVWAQRTLGARHLELRPASADASFRRYFRVSRGDASFIVMDAPPGKESTRPYVRAARRLRELGLNVPRVIASDPERGFVLVSDLGDTSYLDALTPGTVERLYGDATAALALLQAGTSAEPEFFPPYDAPLLRRELELFPQWFLQRHLGLAGEPERARRLDAAFAQLVARALEQPRVWVHRDYHSRNLMVTAQDNPGILDFQDAVCGPVTYDLVSLLRDCYIDWPEDDVQRWARAYHALARRSGLPVGDDDDRFVEWFDWMGVQRHLKAVGIFARLYHRDGKDGYLRDIPRTLGYVERVCRRYPALAPLHAVVAPLLEDTRPWTH